MAEYIEREALIAAINKDAERVGADCPWDITAIETVIEAQPAADVAPVVHGRWEFKNNGRYGQTRCYCTACGKHSGIGGIRENQMKPYCPNCGARMDGE